MSCESKEDVVSNVFEDFEDNIGNAEYFKNRILLAVTNEFVDECNDEMLKKIPRDFNPLQNVDTIDDVHNTTMFPEEFLNSLNLSGLPQYFLKLK